MSTPHGDIGLGGPGLWVIGIALILVAICAAAVLVDVARRRSRAGGPVLLAVWVATQVAYLASFAWGFAATKATDVSGRALLIALPVAIAAQAAYAFTVVFPRHPGRSRGETSSAGADASGEDPFED